MYLRIDGKFKSATKIGSSTHIRKVLHYFFAEDLQIKKITEVRIFADLRFLELICGPPTFEKQYLLYKICTAALALLNQFAKSGMMQDSSLFLLSATCTQSPPLHSCMTHDSTS